MNFFACSCKFLQWVCLVLYFSHIVLNDKTDITCANQSALFCLFFCPVNIKWTRKFLLQCNLFHNVLVSDTFALNIQVSHFCAMEINIQGTVQGTWVKNPYYCNGGFFHNVLASETFALWRYIYLGQSALSCLFCLLG